MSQLDNVKLKNLFNRAYNSKMDKTDHEDFKTYCSRVFSTDYPDPSLLHQFNSLVVQKADEIAKPKVSEVISLLASFKTADRNTVVKYKMPQKFKAKVQWSANGSGVDLVRIDGQQYVTAVPSKFSTGFYYEPFGDTKEVVEHFNTLIEDVANAKVRLYLEAISKITQKAILSGKIPSKNVKQGANLKIADYNSLASVLSRYGGRPIFVADSLLIDYFALQQPANLISDSKKDELLTSLNITTIGRTNAANLINPFIDDSNSKVELPVNVGYMFAGDVKQKPFAVTEFGALQQMTEQNMEDERIKMKIVQFADVRLLFGQILGILKEDAAVAI
ncbi:hypothetical protein [Brevibacillus laterosporus]|uniref:Uncharacterized protein n=1 Tax=Brevibacillus laterosporus TaxID=1465 RepID=A0AAP8U749_BRELA|nr:hypothetical protein [Brevibacillus laterosporus]MBG9776193.1 hypothetical protein [Brevibacillus laterosporus]PPB12839.1 hypothetical protein C4A77_00195 [Brevibacillus laterosporus]